MKSQISSLLLIVFMIVGLAFAQGPKLLPTTEAEQSQKAAEAHQAAEEKAAQEKAAAEKATKEKAEQVKADQEKAAKEKAAKEKAAKEKAEKEQAEKEKAAKEKAEKERAEREQKVIQPAADKAKEDFKPLTEEDVETARKELKQRSRELEKKIDHTTEFGDQWLEYLAWEGVQKQTFKESKLDAPAAKKSLRLLMSGTPGLEAKECQAVAGALEKFIDVASFQAAKQQEAVYKKLVDDLVENYIREPEKNVRKLYEVERRLDYIGQLGQAPELVSAIRSRFSEPNLHAEISKRLLTRFMSKPVSSTTPITDNILGTSITGTGYTTGCVCVHPQNSYGTARLLFDFSGTTQSSTVGRNGPVAIRTAGTTTFTAQKVVELDDEFFRIHPACVDADLESRTLSVNKVGGRFGRRIVERIARKKVAQSKRQADAIATEHARPRIAGEFDKQLTERITDARRRYDARVRRPARAHYLTPQGLEYSSTTEGIQLKGLEARRGQLGADSLPPVGGITGDLTAKIHQSVVNNLGTQFLGGTKFSQEDIDEKITVSPPLPHALSSRLKDRERAEPSEERRKEFKPWAVELRETRPVSVTFKDGQMEVIIHATKITSGKETFPNWDVVLKFEVQQGPEGWELTRVGDIELFPAEFDPAGEKKLTSRQLALRSNLNKAINKADEALGKSVKIGRLEISNPESQVRALTTQNIMLGGGWFVGAWNAE